MHSSSYSPSKINNFAESLVRARASGRKLAPLTMPRRLTLKEGYDVAQRIVAIRKEQGDKPIGRKLGFTDRTLWPTFSGKELINAPVWGHMYDSTVRFSENNRGIQSLSLAVQPQIEAEIVFRLNRTPEPDIPMEEMAGCIEWMAHGCEIVVCPYPDWKFEPADSVAAFCLHGTLIVGEPKVLSAASQRHLVGVLAHASVSLSCDGSLRTAGFGSSVLDNPVHALWYLHQLLQTQPQCAPLTKGEIISTGSWTGDQPVAPGQTWATAFSGVSLPGLTISFV